MEIGGNVGNVGKTPKDLNNCLYLRLIMMEIGFKAKPKKIGNSYYIRVPIGYVENNIVPETVERQFIVREIKEVKEALFEFSSRDLVGCV